MDEQKEMHTKGFLLEKKEANKWLWLRREGMRKEPVFGSVFYEQRYLHEEIEYAARTFVHGLSFKDFCAQNNLILSTFVRILKSAIKGIQSLHEQDIFHGKITANNLIISAYDGQPIWVDHTNEGSKQADWEQLWSLFLSQCDQHDVGVEFFCVQLRNVEDKQGFIENWSSDTSLWDRECVRDFLCDGIVQPERHEEDSSQEKERYNISQEQRQSWEDWIAAGKQGKVLSSLFLETYPSQGKPNLLHAVCEGILLGRMRQETVQQYEEMFGTGQENEELMLADKAVSSAQKVWDLEQEIEQLESLSWYERNFGDAKEALSSAREEFGNALKEREEFLPKLVPRARGLLDNKAALKIAQKKREKMIRSGEETHDWRAWFPEKIYTPQAPYPLGVHKRSLDIQGAVIHFRRMPQGFWNSTPMNHSMWISQCLITQSLYTAVTGNQTSWMEGDDIPAHMMTYGDALHFCNCLSEMFSVPRPYLFSGGTWSCVSREGFRLLDYEEFCYALTTTGIPTSDEELFRQAWCSENSMGKICSIRTKEPNNWGLFDIMGGMEEWVWTEEDASVRIGGSWYHDRWAARNLQKKMGAIDLKADTIGFRIVISDMIKEGFKGVSLG